MYKRAVSLALLALLAGGLEGLAQKPSKPARDATALRQTPPVAQVSLATVAESEPNDDNTTADAVTLGDVGVGETSPAGDWDWWSFTATAGQIIEIDVDANDFGSPLDPVIQLYASDGETVVAYNDDWNDGGIFSYDSRIEYTVQDAGTYYLAITDYDTYWGTPNGDTTFNYTINFNILPPGPGDPATPLITGLYCIQGLAVGYDGTLYVSNPCDSEIYTVNTSGVAATFTTAVMNPGPLTFDAFGNLLAVSQNDGNIYKISPDEEVDTFVVGVYAGWLATAPDGSIWVGGGGGVNGPSEFGGPQVAAPVSGGLRHYDAMGTLVDSIVFETSQPGPFTFGPDGTLYYLGRSIVLGSAGGTDLNVPVGGDSLFKLVDGTPQALFGVPCCFSDLVIDGDGNFYLTNSEYGEVARYGPTGTLLEDPFARTPNSPRFIRFGRDADGKPNTTLYISDYEEGGPRSPEMNPPTEGSELISTLNPDAVDTPGVGNAAMDVLVDDDIAAALMGDPDALNDGEMDFLDFMGNQNGEFDIGDLRAYLIYIGVLPEN